MNNQNNYADPTIEEIELALTFIDANTDRDEWARVAMAVKSELGESGFDIWDAWSRRGDNYNQRDARDTWRSVKQGGGVGIATLFKLARDNGYRNDNSQFRQIDPEAAAARRAQREAEAAREAAETAKRQERAAADARAIWDAATPATGHPYLTRKHITKPGHVRVGVYRRWHDGDVIDIPGALLIPLRDGARITSVQAIFQSDANDLGRDRDYLPGGRKQGCYFNIGKPTGEPGERVLIGEGYATVASACEATGSVGVVAFDSGNLVDVAQVIRAKLPQARIVLLADNDRFGRVNTGVTKSQEAARLVGGLVAVPSFSSDAGQPTDFNDLHVLEGLDLVRSQIDAAFAPVANDNHRKPESRDAQEWPKPLDVFGVRRPPAVPMDVLPEAFRAYVEDQAALTGCDAGIIGLGALVSAAACITDGIRLQPKRKDPTWTESARLWFAVVGDPSAKKSPAISKAVRHVKRIDRHLAEENAKAYSDWKWQHDSWKDAKKADKSGAGPEPEQPGVQRLIVEDVTVEALTEVLKANPRGVLTLKDELTGWFASMDAYKSGAKGASMDRAHWLEAYNGGPRSIDRVTRGNIYVPNWSTCIIGGVQPDMIRRVASSMGNDGLLQRFMVLVARPAVLDEDRTPDMDAMKRFGDLFDRLAALQGTDNHVMMTEEAYVARERVARKAKRLIDAMDHPHLQAWLGKWDGLFGRLACTYHVIECAEAGIYPTEWLVSQQTAERVEQLMCNVLLHHAIHFYTELLDANDRQEHIRQLARLILARKMTRVSKRDMALYWKAAQRLQWWETRAVVETLCTMGWLEPEAGAIDTDGKPRAWIVNPAVHEAFQDHGERERERRKEASQALRELFAAGRE